MARTHFEKSKSISQKITVASNTPGLTTSMLLYVVGIGFVHMVLAYVGDVHGTMFMGPLDFSLVAVVAVS